MLITISNAAGVDKDVKDMTLAEVQGLKIQQDGRHQSYPLPFERLSPGPRLKDASGRAQASRCRTRKLCGSLRTKDEGVGSYERTIQPCRLDLSVMEEVEESSGD